MEYTAAIERVEDYFRQRPYYYTDGLGHFFSHVSHRKAKGLRYVGRFLNAKEARKYWEERESIVAKVKGLW